MINLIKSLRAALTENKEQKSISQAWDEEYARAKPAEYPCVMGPPGIAGVKSDREWRGPAHDGETGSPD